jgi:ribosomal protein L32
VHGYIGIIEFAFCQECLNGVREMFEKNHICPECGYFEGGEDADDI